MATQLKEPMGHRRKVTILGICCIGSLLVALVIYGLWWTNDFHSIPLPTISLPNISVYVVLGVLCVLVLSVGVLGIWLVIELTKYRSWSYQKMLTWRTGLIFLLLVCYVGLIVLSGWHTLSSSVKGCCAHVTEFSDGYVPGGKFDYVYDKAGNKLVDQNGNVVKLYFQSYGGYHLVVDDSSGRVVGHNEEDPLVKEEDNTSE